MFIRARRDFPLPGANTDMLTTPPSTSPPRRAAQYVRMSTEHQQYSTENQADRILEYARHNRIEIVRTYADEGKSGLNIGGRGGLQRLLDDVRNAARSAGSVMQGSGDWRYAPAKRAKFSAR